MQSRSKRSEKHARSALSAADGACAPARRAALTPSAPADRRQRGRGCEFRPHAPEPCSCDTLAACAERLPRLMTGRRQTQRRHRHRSGRPGRARPRKAARRPRHYEGGLLHFGVIHLLPQNVRFATSHCGATCGPDRSSVGHRYQRNACPAHSQHYCECAGHLFAS